MNYTKKPSLYNTGYVLNDDVSRMKQGLMSQNLASVCFVNNPEYDYQVNTNNLQNIQSNSIYCKNCYNYNKVNYNVFVLAQKSTQNKLIPPVLNKNLLYPIHNDGVKYGLREINNNCECVRYIQAP